MTRGGRLVAVAALVGLLGPAAPAARAQSVVEFRGVITKVNELASVDDQGIPLGRNEVRLYLSPSGMTGQMVVDVDSAHDPEATSPNCVKLDADIPKPIGSYDASSPARQQITGQIAVVTSFAQVPCKDMSPQNTNARTDVATLVAQVDQTSILAHVRVAEEQSFDFIASRVGGPRSPTGYFSSSPSPSPTASGLFTDDSPLIALLDPTAIAVGPINDIMIAAGCPDRGTNERTERCRNVNKQVNEFIALNSPQFTNHPQVIKDLAVAVGLAGLRNEDGTWAAPALRAFLPSLALLAASANFDNNEDSAVALTRAVNLLATLRGKNKSSTAIPPPPAPG